MKKTNALSGLHEIKNKKRPRAVNRKKKGLCLEGKRRHRVAKLVACLSAMLVIGLGAFLINAFFLRDDFVADTSRSASISATVPTDGSTPMDYDDPRDGSIYKGLDNFAFINGRFRERDHWYSEMHGTTTGGVMGINVDQSVNTWKQYSDGILILVDVTTSSMVNAARQFCYVGDDVIWRVADCDPSAYNGIDTPWPDGEPFGHLTLEDFRKGYGLPGTELSVYIFNEENVLSADPVVDNGNGTYSQTWYLDPADDRAPYFYRYQMQKTGNLTGLPTFYDITVTYTFDETWSILESRISEHCNAPMGVPADCSSDFVTTYDYAEEKAAHTAYDNYFNRYADKPATGEKETPITATECLSQAFGSITEGSSSLNLDLDLNGTPVGGVVNLTMGDEISVKARLGNIDIWYENDAVYLEYGKLRAKLSVNEFMELVTSLLPEDGGLDLGAGLDLNTILTQLVADGDFVLGDTEATLSSKLSLFGLELPVEFSFEIGEGRKISLKSVSADIDIKDFKIGAALAFGDKLLPELPEDSATFVDLMPYADSLAKLFTSEALRADLSYENADAGISVSGGLDIALGDAPEIAGDITVNYKSVQKRLLLGYKGGDVYLDLDGVKVCANLSRAIGLVKSFLPTGDAGFDLSALLANVFTDDFADLISLKEQENRLDLAVRGSELLSMLGVSFDKLGAIAVSVDGEKVEASVLGAKIVLSEGASPVAAEADGYTSVTECAEQLAPLFKNNELGIDLTYEQGALTVSGHVDLSVKPFAAKGEISLTYGGESKTLSVIYSEDGNVLLALDTLKLAVNAKEAVAIVQGFIGADDASDEEVSLLEKILGLTFGDFIELSEGEHEFSAVVGTASLLAALNVSGLDLGSVTLTVKDGGLTVLAAGATVSVGAGKPFKTEQDGYLDITDHLGYLADLLGGDFITAQISYDENGISVSGKVQIGLKTKAAQATVTVTAGEKSKQLTVVYGEDRLYLDLDGVKMSADVQSAIDLVKSLLQTDGAEQDAQVNETLRTLFSLDFGDFLAADVKDGFTLTVKGTQLLKALLPESEFALGDVVLSVREGALEASLLNAGITVTAGGEFELGSLDAYREYPELVKYAKFIADLVKGGYLTATVGYADESGLSVSGSVSLSLDPFGVEGDLTLTYEKNAKTAHFVYTDEWIYLTIEGLKVKANAAEAADLLKDLVLPQDAQNGEQDGEQSAISDLLGKLFTLDFSDLITLKEEKDVLSLTLGGDALLSAFDVDRKLGAIEFQVSERNVFARVLGAEITLESRAPFTATPKGDYADLTPVVRKLPAVLREEALSLYGDVTLTLGDTVLTLIINDGGIFWKNGFELYLDATLDVLDTKHDLTVAYADGILRILYGGYGAQLSVTGDSSDLAALEQAFLAVYNRVRGIVGEAIPEENANPLPVLEKFSDLLGFLKGGESASAGLSALDLGSILGKLAFCPPETEEGLFSLALGDLKAELQNGLEDDLLSLSLLYAGKNADDLRAEGDLRAAARTEGYTLPACEYLGVGDFEDLLDYLGAAAALVGEDHLNISLTGTQVTSTDEKYDQYNHVKFNIDGGIRYYSGGGFPLTLDIDKKELTVNAKLFLQVTFKMFATHADDQNLELLITVLDADKTGAQDGKLDFYISASTVGKDSGREGYEPLLLYAPTNEVMTIASGLVSMLGVDSQLVNDYLVGVWLTDLETVEQLKGLGDALKDMLGGLLGGEDDPVAAALEASGEDKRGAISSFARSEGSFTLALDASVLFGKEGLDDLRVTLSKEKDEAGNTFLSALTLANIYNKEGTEKTTVQLSVSRADVAVERPAASSDYFSVDAVDILIKSLAKSTTHRVDDEVISGEAASHRYELNKNFYINGSATLDLLGDLAHVNIDVIALSVNLDEDGKVGVNLRLEYKGLHNALGGILGDSDIIKGDTTLDLTIKSSPREGEGIMLYMKREQTTDSEHKALAAPIVIYRALPLSNFMAHYMDHICFMFNLSETVINRIMSMVGSGSGGGSASPSDLGGWLHKIVNSCSYEKTGEGDKWTLDANGEGITGSSSFKKMQISVTTDSEGYLRTIVADLDIASAVTVHATLRWCNPGGNMDAGVRDVTSDIAETLEKAMDVKLKSADWNKTDFLEGQITKITYWMGDDKLGEQEVVFDPATGESFASLVYPSLEKYVGREGYEGHTPVWDAPAGGKVEADLKIYAKYRPNVYRLVFRSAERIVGADGYDESFDEAENVWLYARDWTYGTEIALPFAATNTREITYFECAHGHRYAEGDALTLHVYTDSTITFTAHWEDIVYSVDFVSEGKIVKTVTGSYGETVVPPAKEEVPEKTGYTFDRWENAPETFVDRKATATAAFTPNHYTVTLQSDYDVPEEGFKLNPENGKYEKEVEFVYDGVTPLPTGIRTADGGHILNGFAWGGKTYVDRLPNILSDAVFTAVWEEVGVDVYFADEDGHIIGSIKPRNKQVGSSFTEDELPDVPARDGYTGEWDIAPDYTVPAEGNGEDGKIVICAKYTGITYIIYGLSRFEIDGFELAHKTFDSEGIKGDEFYYTRLEYVYGTHAGTDGGYHLREGLSESQLRYDFGGWFTSRFGEGTKVEYMNDSIIAEVFRFNVGDGDDRTIDGKNILYADWIDNSVEVVLYSDFDFAGSAGNHLVGDASCYYTTKMLMGGSHEQYDVSDIALQPKTSGLRRLGWWYNDPEQGWRLVDNVDEFRNTDTREQAIVELFAMWIEEIEVKITNIATPDYMGGKHYDIAGTVTGGLPIGVTSKKVYDAVGMSYSASGLFVLYNANGTTSDAPGGKETIAIDYGDDNVGTFSKTDMNSMTFAGTVGKPIADYGGLLLQMTFVSSKYSSLRLVFTDGDVVSVAGYTVRYLDAEGLPIDVRENVHIAYHGNLSNSKVDFDISGITVKPVCLKDVFPNGKEFPEKFGYSGKWSMGLDEEIVGVTDVRPVYTANACEVTFVSDEKLGVDWVKDGEYDGKYVYQTIMGYESLVSFWCGDSQLEGGRTVSLIASENVFYLPAKPKFNETIDGKWDVKIGHDGATFTVVYDLDTVNYHSALAFNYNGSDVTNATVQFNETTDPQGLALMSPANVTVDGVTYRFLGWFEQKNGAWTKVETVMPSTSESAAHVTVTVEALWASEVSVSIVSADKAGAFGGWSVTATISTSGGTLAGSEELLSAVTVSAKVQYSSNKSTSSPESWDAKNNVKHDITLGGGDSIDRAFAYTSKDYLWCELRATYSVNGVAVGTLSATAVKAI